MRCTEATVTQAGGGSSVVALDVYKLGQLLLRLKNDSFRSTRLRSDDDPNSALLKPRVCVQKHNAKCP